MTEEVKIKLTSELDSKGYDELRKKLNESRNELNALARATEKGSKEYKTYKESVKEINRIVKLSDADLKKYTQSIIAEEQALKKAEKGTDGLSKSTKGLSDRFVITAGDIGGAITGISGKLSGLVTSYNELENSNRKLFATSKLTGASFEFLQDVTKDAQLNLGLTTKDSNELTIALAKLGQKAGDTTKTKDALKALMDLGSAQGLNVEESITAINQAILGIDEGTDKLFQKNPSVIYDEYAKSIGTTAGKLTDQQKAQALLNETISQGSKVQGEYNKYLETSAGKQQLLTQKVEVLKQEFGETVSKGIEPFIDAILNANDSTGKFVGGVAVVGSTVAEAIPLLAGLRVAFEGVGTGAGTSASSIARNFGKGGLVVGAIAASIYAISLLVDEVNKIGGEIKAHTPKNDGVILPNKREASTNFYSDEEVKDFQDKTKEFVAKQKESKKLTESEIFAKVNGGGSVNAVKEKEVQLTNELITAQNSLNDLLAKESTFTADQKNQKVYIDYLKEVEDLKRKIKNLGTESFIVPTGGIRLDERILEKKIPLNVTQSEDQIRSDNLLNSLNQPEQINESFNKTVEEVDTINTSIVSTMQLFNLGVESGIGQFLNGLTSAVQLIKTLQTVNSILGLIPGFASGGSFGPGPIKVGEQGTELLWMSQPGYVMNHGDSQRYINQSITSNASPVNVYVNSNIDAMKFFKDEFPKYRNYEKGKRIN